MTLKINKIDLPIEKYDDEPFKAQNNKLNEHTAHLNEINELLISLIKRINNIEVSMRRAKRYKEMQG